MVDTSPAISADSSLDPLVRISPEIPIEIHIKLKAIALAERRTLGDLACECLIKYLKYPLRVGRLPIVSGVMTQISIRCIPKTVYTELKILAIRESMPLKYIVWDALSRHIDPVWDKLSKAIKKGLEDAALLHKTGT